ncbi:MAG: hypothetical protein V4651_04605 [Bacteroidota bacterium]
MKHFYVTLLLVCCAVFAAVSQNNPIVPADGSSVTYQSSISCNTTSSLTLTRGANGQIKVKRVIKIQDNKDIPSDLVVENTVPFVQNNNGLYTLTIPDNGLHYWIIPFEPGADPVAIPNNMNVQVNECYCKEAPPDYSGSAYCELGMICGPVNKFHCIHKACCECKLITTGTLFPTGSGAGVILSASTIVFE